MRGYPVEVQDAAIDQSINSQYQGLFPADLVKVRTKGEKLIQGDKGAQETDSLLLRYVSKQILRFHALALSYGPPAELTEHTIQAFYDAMIKHKLTDEDVPRLRAAIDAYILHKSEWPKPAEVIAFMPRKTKALPKLEGRSEASDAENRKRLQDLLGTLNLGVANGTLKIGQDK